MREYIKKLQNKPEDVRKRIVVGTVLSCMVLVFAVWVYNLTDRFSSPDIKEQVRSDIKPFTLFKNSMSDTYKNISASVGKASVLGSEEKKVEEKQIDLIVVDKTTTN